MVKTKGLKIRKYSRGIKMGGLVPFLYGFLLKTREGTESERYPRDLGTYQAYSIDRAAEAVMGLWARDEIKDRLADLVSEVKSLEGADHFVAWVERNGGRVGVTDMDRAVKNPPKRLVDEDSVAGRKRTMNLTKKSAYDPHDLRYRASMSPRDQLNMGTKSRSRGNYKDTPPVHRGSLHMPFFLDDRLRIHPHMGVGGGTLDAFEHKLKIRDYETFVWDYAAFVRLTRADWERRGIVPVTISDFDPFDFLKCPELVFEEFTRRYVDGQRLAYISFELAEMYKRYLTDEFMTLLKEGRGYFGLIPLMRQFSDIGDAIKEEAIKALWRDEKGNVRYDFLGHGLERVYPETQELFGRGPIESFIYVRRERRDIPKRKRAHIVINPETELAYYIFKVPVGEADRLTKGKPLVTYQEECTAFRQPVFCAVFEPVEGMISPEIARKYREIKK